MMKKILCLLLALLLCPVFALAEDSAADMLSCKELTVWAQGYIARAAAAEPLNDPAENLTAEGYEFIYPFATLYADLPQMGEDTKVNTIVLTASEENGPRGVNVNSPLSEVLAAYYSENAELAGNREAAVLYQVDQLPEAAMWAQVNRDGQRVQTVQYAVHEQLASGGEGYSDMGVIYTMAENRVSAVRVYGLSSSIAMEEVDDVMYNVMLAAIEEDYVQVPFSYVGTELTAFSEEDLVFSGMDFLNVTPESAAALLGEPLSDTWVENGDEGFIRVQTYAGCEMIWLYNKQKTEGSIYMLYITADGLEGPRAVRYGDAFSSVYNRFRNGEGEYQEDGSELLYGDGATGSFGMANYGYDASATLRYGFDLEDGRKVVLELDFTVMELTAAMLYVE